MVFLSVEKRHGHAQFRGDARLAARSQSLVVTIPRRLRLEQLLRCTGVDCRTVLATAVIALAQALGGIVGFPEHLEQSLEAEQRRIPDYQYHFRVAGKTAADVLVGCVGGKAACITHRRGDHAGNPPEQAFGAPEAAQSEEDLLETGSKGRDHAAAVDVMTWAEHHGLQPVGQCFLCTDHALLWTFKHCRFPEWREP